MSSSPRGSAPPAARLRPSRPLRTTQRCTSTAGGGQACGRYGICEARGSLAGSGELAARRNAAHPTPTSQPYHAMKITTLLVLKSPGDSASTSGVGEQQQQAVMLANASNVSHFCYFQHPAALEFILFAALEFILCAPWQGKEWRLLTDVERKGMRELFCSPCQEFSVSKQTTSQQSFLSAGRRWKLQRT